MLTNLYTVYPLRKHWQRKIDFLGDFLEWIFEDTTALYEASFLESGMKSLIGWVVDRLETIRTLIIMILIAAICS